MSFKFATEVAKVLYYRKPLFKKISRHMVGFGVHGHILPFFVIAIGTAILAQTCSAAVLYHTCKLSGQSKGSWVSDLTASAFTNGPYVP